MFKKVHRLLCRRHGILRWMKQQQWARRNLANHIIGFKVVHALHHFIGKFSDGAWGQMVSESGLNGHDVVAGHHHGFASCQPLAAFGHHVGKLFPSRIGLVLLAEFLFTVAPSASGNTSCNACINACGVNSHRSSKAVPHDANAIRVNLR